MRNANGLENKGTKKRMNRPDIGKSQKISKEDPK